MIGMDCDRPRGEFINSKEGTSMAERKINSIENALNEFINLRTIFQFRFITRRIIEIRYFVCEFRLKGS